MSSSTDTPSLGTDQPAKRSSITEPSSSPDEKATPSRTKLNARADEIIVNPVATNRSNRTYLVPITYYPLATQRVFTLNARAIANKPYARYFHSDLYIYSDIPPFIRTPMPATCVLSIQDAPNLLQPGYYSGGENGWLELSDGTGYVASLTRFPDVTGDMIRWWFWWHSVESERYMLWFPYDHLSVRSSFADRLHRKDVSDTAKWLSSTHHVREFVGSQEMALRICFVDPAQYGLSWEKLREAGYEAAVCAELRHAMLPMKMGDFLHLWRRTEDGLELRSRYWLGGGVRLELPFGVKIGLDYLGELTGIKRRMAGERIAYEHFIHDQIEFTNLARILPGLYEDWKAGRV